MLKSVVVSLCYQKEQLYIDIVIITIDKIKRIYREGI
jgi:hypothetical protein